MSVERQVISSIGQGLLVFAAVAPTDGEKEVEAMASKVLRFKVWPDEASSGVRVLRLLIEWRLI